MSDDYLKAARTNSVNAGSNMSEVALIESNEALSNAFQELTAMRKIITDQKTSALVAIDEQHRDALKSVEAQYAMILSLSR